MYIDENLIDQVNSTHLNIKRHPDTYRGAYEKINF